MMFDLVTPSVYLFTKCKHGQQYINVYLPKCIYIHSEQVCT